MKRVLDPNGNPRPISMPDELLKLRVALVKYWALGGGIMGLGFSVLGVFGSSKSWVLIALLVFIGQVISLLIYMDEDKK